MSGSSPIPHRRLLGVRTGGPDGDRRHERPDTPLALGCLLAGTRLDPSLVSQLRKELASADRVDILCSFIKWSGLRILEDDLRAFTARTGARLRVLTTSYMGATDLKAVDLLQTLERTEVRVSYDTHRTRLHAKAYLFHRDSGFSTAYVGSANLSRPALTEGLEWTVKVAGTSRRTSGTGSPRHSRPTGRMANSSRMARRSGRGSGRPWSKSEGAATRPAAKPSRSI